MRAEETASSIHPLLARDVAAMPGVEGRLLARTTHTLAEAKAAVDDGVDYISVGTVYPTPTKAAPAAVGTGLVSEVAAIVDRPWVAVGGIDHDNAPDVIEAGAPAIAVGGAGFGETDPAPASRRAHAMVITHPPEVSRGS